MTLPLPTIDNAPLNQLQPIRFTAIAVASLNGGVFLFDGATKYPFRPVGKVSSEAVFVFDTASIKGSVPEYDYIASIDPTSWPLASVWSTASGDAGTPMFPVPVACYTDACPFRLAWNPSGDPDSLSLTMTGQLNPTLAILASGATTINLVLTLTGYQIGSYLWKEEFLKGWEQSWIGDAYRGEISGSRSVSLRDGATVLRSRGY
jgi:hypothetical protein